MADVGVALGIAGIGVALPALAQVRLSKVHESYGITESSASSPTVDGRHIWQICCQQV